MNSLANMSLRLAADVGPFVILIIWLVMAAVGWVLKQRQGGKRDWEEDDSWGDSTPAPKQRPASPPRQQSRPQQPPPRQSPPRRQPGTPSRQPATSSTAQARNVIEEAIRRQQEAQRRQQAPPRQADPMPAAPPVVSTPPMISQPSMRSVPDVSGLPVVPGGIGDMPATVQTGKPTKKQTQLRFKSRDEWRRAVLLREVLERPRAFDT